MNENATNDIIKDLVPVFKKKYSKMRPRELVTSYRAFTNAQVQSDELDDCLIDGFKTKFERMRADDVTWFYECLAKNKFPHQGRFYKYI